MNPASSSQFSRKHWEGLWQPRVFRRHHVTEPKHAQVCSLSTALLVALLADHLAGRPVLGTPAKGPGRPGCLTAGGVLIQKRVRLCRTGICPGLSTIKRAREELEAPLCHSLNKWDKKLPGGTGRMSGHNTLQFSLGGPRVGNLPHPTDWL